MLLFSFDLKDDSIFAGFGALPPGITSLPPEQLRDFVGRFAELERRLLGETFLAARRITRWPLGRVTLNGSSVGFPAHADIYLQAHKSRVALWEIWLHAAEQPFSASRWIDWLNPESDNSVVAQLWRALAPIHEAIAVRPTLSGNFFPVIMLRLPQHPIKAIVEQHGHDIVRLLFLHDARWTLKRKLVLEELERDYCAREGGMTLLARRSGLDLHARESLVDEEDFANLPPRTALPFVVTLEILLLERAVLQRLNERLTGATAGSVDDLLALKREIRDALEEYYGAITTATRFSDAITVVGERLLNIDNLYEAVMDRLEVVSFEITTRYQKRMMTFQFWLTIVFGATEIGFIASGIATWHYRTNLTAVLAWTIGAAVLSGIALVSLLRGKLN